MGLATGRWGYEHLQRCAHAVACMQVVQQGLEVLCVSQFTLFNIMKGNKPDFHLAMPPTQVELCLTVHAGLG